MREGVGIVGPREGRCGEQPLDARSDLGSHKVTITSDGGALCRRWCSPRWPVAPLCIDCAAAGRQGRCVASLSDWSRRRRHAKLPGAPNPWEMRGIRGGEVRFEEDLILWAGMAHLVDMSRVGGCAAFGLSAAFVLGLVACGSSDAGSGGAGASSGDAGAGGAPVVTAGTGGSVAGTEGSAAGAPSAGAAGAPGSAGSAGTAGSAGAASAGTGGTAGSAGAPATCLNAGTELCDDFESGSLDTQRWAQSKSANSSIAVETGTAHSGTHAVHLKFMANAQSTVTITESATFAAQGGAPAPANKFYSRMYAWFGPDIPKATMMDFHTGFMVGGGKNDKGDVTVGMGMIGSDQQYLGYSIFFGTPKLEFGPWSNPRIVPKMWQCIELLEDGTDPTTEIRKVWLNDTEMKELESDSAKAAIMNNNNPNHLPPKFDKVTFGVIEYHPIPTLSDMWIDDIKISANKIGCN